MLNNLQLMYIQRLSRDCQAEVGDGCGRFGTSHPPMDNPLQAGALSKRALLDLTLNFIAL